MANIDTINRITLLVEAFRLMIASTAIAVHLSSAVTNDKPFIYLTTDRNH